MTRRPGRGPYQSYDSESDFRVGGPGRKQAFTVPFATTVLEKIEIYDSIVLAHRANGRREPPRAIYK